MKNKKDYFGIFLIFKNLLQAYTSKISLLSQLFGLEAKLASKTLITMIVMGILLIFFVVISWCSLLLLLFVYLISLQFSLVASAFVIALINIALCASLLFYVLYIKKNLFFPATCRQLANMKLLKK